MSLSRVMFPQSLRVVAGLFLATLVAQGAPAGQHTGARGVGADAPYSRAAVLRRFARHVPISGGALGTVAPGLEAQVAPLPVARAPRGPAAYSAVRVSTDLLPPDGIAEPRTQVEPYLAVDPASQDALLAGWQESRFTNGGSRCNGVAASRDGGRTWAEQLVPHLTVADGGEWDRATDPWTAFGPNGKAYLVSVGFNERNAENAVLLSVSEDGGLTFGDPVDVFRAPRDFSDKESMTVDTFPTSPHFGTVYVAWDSNHEDGRGAIVAQRLVVARSTDGGATFAPPSSVRKKGSNIGIIPRVGPDGTVYAVWAGGSIDATAYRLYFSKSIDGGATWAKARSIERIRAQGVSGLRSGDFLPSFDVDRVTGQLSVAWMDKRWTGTDQPTVMTSSDGGATWSSAARVPGAADDASLFTATIAAGSSGEVAVSFYGREGHAADVYVVVSRDGAASFGPLQRVTPTSFDLMAAATAGGLSFLGDYMGLVFARGVPLPLYIATFERAPGGDLQPDVFFGTPGTP